MAELCYKCFREYESGGVCPHCGYNAADDAGKYPHALKAGSVLGGRYIVGRVLGQGGFGITYMAQDYNTKQLVAIKEYLPEQYATRIDHSRVSVYSAQHEADFLYGRENFLQEARTLSQFNGIENICDIYSYFEENGTAYFAMEYVEGMGLDKYMRSNGLLSFEQAEALLLPVMYALAAVHSRGIIHRDISPDNIMIRADGRAMLIDFGAARYSMGEKSRSLDVILKHGFAPKEQYTRHGRQGAYTDVYAMAATFYYAITGKLPPDAIERSDADTLIAPSKLGVRISRASEQALLKAMAPKATDRFQTMHEFAQKLGSTQKQAEGGNKKLTLLLGSAFAALAVVIAVVAFSAAGKQPAAYEPDGLEELSRTETEYSAYEAENNPYTQLFDSEIIGMGDIISGYWAEERVDIRGGYTTPYVPDRPVEDCRGIILALKITDYSGDVGGDWELFYRKSGEDWASLGVFWLAEESLDGEALYYSFDFGESISFDELAIHKCDDSEFFDVSWESSFYSKANMEESLRPLDGYYDEIVEFENSQDQAYALTKTEKNVDFVGLRINIESYEGNIAGPWYLMVKDKELGWVEAAEFYMGEKLKVDTWYDYWLCLNGVYDIEELGVAKAEYDEYTIDSWWNEFYVLW